MPRILANSSPIPMVLRCLRSRYERRFLSLKRMTQGKARLPVMTAGEMTVDETSRPRLQTTAMAVEASDRIIAAKKRSLKPIKTRSASDRPSIFSSTQVLGWKLLGLESG